MKIIAVLLAAILGFLVAGPVGLVVLGGVAAVIAIIAGAFGAVDRAHDKREAALERYEQAKADGDGRAADKHRNDYLDRLYEGCALVAVIGVFMVVGLQGYGPFLGVLVIAFSAVAFFLGRAKVGMDRSLRQWVMDEDDQRFG